MISDFAYEVELNVCVSLTDNVNCGYMTAG